MGLLLKASGYSKAKTVSQSPGLLRKADVLAPSSYTVFAPETGSDLSHLPSFLMKAQAFAKRQ